MQHNRRGLGAGLITLIMTIPGCWPAPLAWSPDGKWLAYVTIDRTPTGILTTDWLYDSPGADTPEPRREMERLGEPTEYRIWTTRGDNSGSVQIDASPLPLTSPCWNPRGTALAFGKVARLPSGAVEFQIVVQDAPDRRRILVRQPLDELKSEWQKLPTMAPAWSGDGRYLAVPHLQPNGLAIVRADTGQVVKTLDDAYLPSWSPDGSRLAFVRGGETEGLYCLDAGFGSPRLLTEVGPIGQAPSWSRDGQHILTIRGLAQPGDVLKPRLKATLVRVHADSGQFELVRNLENNRFGADPILSEVSAALDRDGENLFFTASNGGLSTIMLWVHTRTNSVRNQFPALHLSIPVGALSIQPTGEQLALRLGTGTGTGPIALMDPQTTKLTPIIPDLASRLEWIRMLVALSRHTIALNSAEIQTKTGVPARPTSLPIPGETPTNSELSNRLRTIGTLGGPICEREGDLTLDAQSRRILLEAKLYFAYLRGDYESSLTLLEEVEPHAQTRNHRLKLLGLRAQIELAKGDLDSATPAIEYLQSIVKPRVFRYETTPSGPVLTPEERESLDWPKALATRLVIARETTAEEDKTDHTNFDAPQPGLGLDPPPVFPDSPIRPFPRRFESRPQ